MSFLELADHPELEENPRELNGGCVVGSGSQASWRLANKDLAARHFAVTTDGNGGARLAPATPQTVVIVNGEQVPPGGRDLRAGDMIGAGSARFIFLVDRNGERPAAPEPSAAHLVDATQRKGYHLKRRVVQIGREIGCNIVLRDPTVSRFHADIRSEGGEHVIYSIGSAGTKLNGQPLTTPSMLREGDQIQIGGTTFTFTKGRLPGGVVEVDFEDHSDDALNRRSTELHMDTVPAPKPSSGRWSSLTLALGAVLVLAIAVVVWAMLR